MDRVAESGVGREPSGVLSRALRASAPHAWFLEDEVAGLAGLVGPGAVCLDVGAEYGLYTWTLAGLVGRSGHVHAVEPQPGPSAFVDTTRRLLGAGNVTVHRTALGAAAGGGVLALPRRGLLPVHGRAFLTTGASGLGSNAEFAHHDDVPVPVTTLDDLVADLALDRLDLVKVGHRGCGGPPASGGTHHAGDAASGAHARARGPAPRPVRRDRGRDRRRAGGRRVRGPDLGPGPRLGPAQARRRPSQRAVRAPTDPDDRRRSSPARVAAGSAPHLTGPNTRGGATVIVGGAGRIEEVGPGVLVIAAGPAERARP